jgi:hypothetical protein
MTDLITMKPSIDTQRHPSTSLWNAPSIRVLWRTGGWGGVYRGVGMGVSWFNRGVKEVGVSRNSVSRHPRGIPRAVFKSPGRGVVVQSKTNTNVM